MTDEVIRLAGPDDGAAIARLRVDWAGVPSDDAFEAEFGDWLVSTAASRLTWLAFVAGEPAGMVSVRVYDRMPKPGRAPSVWGWVGQMYVVEQLRDAGLGTQLLGAAIAHARAAGWSHLSLHPSDRAVPFYRRAGFDTTNLMTLELTNA